jgi:hypothetical protein
VSRKKKLKNKQKKNGESAVEKVPGSLGEMGDESSASSATHVYRDKPSFLRNNKLFSTSSSSSMTKVQLETLHYLNEIGGTIEGLCARYGLKGIFSLFFFCFSSSSFASLLSFPHFLHLPSFLFLLKLLVTNNILSLFNFAILN